jgi:tetratricopeptide (TPR) repeat protein
LGAKKKSVQAPTHKASANEWGRKGAELGKLGRHKEALSCYDKALEIDPKNADVWGMKGAALYELHRYQEAIECCDKALAIAPKYATAQQWKTKALEKIRKTTLQK